MGTPKISVIIPVKAPDSQNVEWLGETLESIMAQTYKDWEVVVCNDRSEAPLRSLASYFKDPRMRGTKSKREGVSNARNQAASIAKGELLLPVDHDDLLPPDALKILVGAWDAGGSKAGIVYGNTILFGQDFQRVFKSPEYSFNHLLQTLVMPIGSLHQKSDWGRVGGWKPQMEGGLEDWEYWIALGELGVCGHHVDKTTYKYRRHPGSRLSKMRETPNAYMEAYKKMRELHQDTYNGGRMAGCCGGGVRPRPAGVQSKAMPSNLRIRPEAVEDDQLVLVVYTGAMRGGFGVHGRPSGVRYNVRGPGRPLEMPDGRQGVFSGDIPWLKRINRGRDFEIVPG